MKKLVLILLLTLLAAPTYAGRDACTAALATAGVCRNATDVLWSLSMTPAASVKLQTALAKKAGWTATVICTQAMVDLTQCTVEQLNTAVTNPQTERQAANAEFRRLIRDEYIRSQDAEAIRAESKAALDAALAAISNPDLGN